MEFMYLVFFQISLKIMDSKKLAQTTDSSDTSVLCDLPSLLSALWPTFSLFMALIQHLLSKELQTSKTLCLSPAVCYCASDNGYYHYSKVVQQKNL